MARKEPRRRINFYQIQAERSVNKGKEKLKIKEINTILKKEYATLKTNKDGYKYKHFETFDRYMIEYIESNENDMFIRVGKETPENVIGKRDHDTGNLTNIELNKKETIEAYTYLYIDFENSVMSFLSLPSAPNRIVFEKYLNSIDEDVSFECNPIVTSEILEKIINKSILGTIQYRYCPPAGEVLKDIPGVTDGVLDSLNISKTTISVSLSPPKKKSVAKKLKELLRLKDDLEQIHGEDLKGMTLNARDEEEEMISYNLLDYKFNSYTYINMIYTLNENDFKDIILKSYSEQKEALSIYVK